MQKGIREKPLKNVARFIAPMKPKMVPRLPDDRAKWLFEPKLDGYRVIGMRTAGRANLYSMDANTRWLPARHAGRLQQNWLRSGPHVQFQRPHQNGERQQ
jgi:hypothetical protein